MDKISGPLPEHTVTITREWCTTWDRARAECDIHSRIVTELYVTGEHYHGQINRHAWHAIAAHRAMREFGIAA